MNEQNILRQLYEYNPWWQASAQAVPKLRRRDFYVLNKQVDDKKITAVIGPRQVGKTTLMKQLINQLLEEKKIRPENILFINGDDVLLTSNADNLIHDCLETYSENILQKPLNSLDKMIYVFIDEIQHAGKWNETLKNYYDLGYKIKFFISGSSSAGITKGASESLVGRICIHILFPMKFSEFLRFKRPEQERKITELSIGLRSWLKDALETKDFSKLFPILQKLRLGLAGNEKEITILLNEYLMKGGYIEVLDEKNLEKCTAELKRYIQLTVYNDITQAFGIRNPREFDQLLAMIASESSQRMTEVGLSKNLKIKIDTLSRYLDLLEEVFLISSSELYSKSRAKRVRNPKKIFINDIGIRNALASSLNSRALEDKQNLGKIVETVVHDHLQRLSYFLANDVDCCFYWKTKKNEELDNVLLFANTPVPIEVKYQENIEAADNHCIKEFFGEFKSKLGIIITKKDLALNKEKNIIQLPLWMFLLIV